jgi:Protein of unknown function (DUF2934)
MLPDSDRDKQAREGEDERIRRRAYDIWESEGRPHGRDEEHWRRAQQDVARESRSGAGTQAVPASRVGTAPTTSDMARSQQAGSAARRPSVEERSSGTEADPLGRVQGESAGAGAGISDDMVENTTAPRPKAAAPRTAKPRASRAKKPAGNSSTPGGPDRPR